MLITYIKSHYAEQITDIDELVTINVNCFDKFSVFREADYTLRNVDGKDNYELPDSVKKYSAYIFNFIFVPKSINNDIFKNYSVRTKMELLSKSNRTSEIKCEYSKMIIDIVKDNGKLVMLI